MRIIINNTSKNNKNFTLVTISLGDDALKTLNKAIDKYLKKETPVVQVMFSNPNINKDVGGDGVVIQNIEGGI